ncbi:ras-related protein Rab-15 isoform X4 [Strix aluco]|uniref:ras-related protein Rab-15 isoform X4 n=1 Tax=Strix aluco TaxID=111821 RepID=UPI003DA2ACD6
MRSHGHLGMGKSWEPGAPGNWGVVAPENWEHWADTALGKWETLGTGKLWAPGKLRHREHRAATAPGNGKPGTPESHGVDFKMKTIEVDGIKVRIQIWDTAGQERYQTITKQYYRRAQGIFLVYDISSERSYQHIVKWASDVDEYAPDGVQKILIGNKADEEHKSWPGSTGWISTRPAPAATST